MNAITKLHAQFHAFICENPLCIELFLPKNYVTGPDGRAYCDALCQHQAEEEDALEEGLMRTLARG